jgi:hypothetical protein
MLAFREAVAELKWEVRRWLGQMVECADENGQQQVVGLDNLYRRARQSPRESWPALIVEFLRAAGTADALENMPDELAPVADKLLLRLGQPMKIASEDAKVWSQPLPGTDLWINLVIDFPNRMFYVTEKLIEQSGGDGQVWLDKALTNLQARTPENCFQKVHDESGLLLCSVCDAYDSSRALLVGALLPAHEELGSLVALPSRDEFLVLPVSKEALPHVHLLKMLAEKNYQSAPYPISNEVYWVRGGAWQLFPIEFKGNEVNVIPPDEFIELLQLGDDDEAETV